MLLVVAATLPGCFMLLHGGRCTDDTDLRRESHDRGDDLLLALVAYRRDHGDYPASLRQLQVPFAFNEGGGYAPSDQRNPGAPYSFDYTRVHGSFELTIWYACTTSRCTLTGDTYRGLWQCTEGH